MRIAVTYENGNVFQHFGHSEQFKVYEVQDGKVLYSEVITLWVVDMAHLQNFLQRTTSMY